MKKTDATKLPKKPLPIDPSRIFVRDVMQADVLVLRVDDSIRWAAEQLEENRASGAPVVDAAGRLIGVLTSTDIARSEHVDDKNVTTRLTPELASGRDPSAEDGVVDDELFPTDEYAEVASGRVRIADWMTPAVTSVAPDATLAEACRVMSDHDVHRVFVVDGGRLLGVVSTMDVVRLLAGRASPAGGQQRR